MTDVSTNPELTTPSTFMFCACAHPCSPSCLFASLPPLFNRDKLLLSSAGPGSEIYRHHDLDNHVHLHGDPIHSFSNATPACTKIPHGVPVGERHVAEGRIAVGFSWLE